MDTVYLKSFLNKKMANPSTSKDVFLFTFSHSNKNSERQHSDPLAVIQVKLLDSGLMSIKKSFIIAGHEVGNINLNTSVSEHIKAQSAMNKAENWVHSLERELGIQFNLNSGEEMVSNTSIEMIEKRLSLMTQSKTSSLTYSYSPQDEMALSM